MTEMWRVGWSQTPSRSVRQAPAAPPRRRRNSLLVYMDEATFTVVPKAEADFVMISEYDADGVMVIEPGAAQGLPRETSLQQRLNAIDQPSPSGHHSRPDR
jgi:hypothetical protein